MTTAQPIATTVTASTATAAASTKKSLLQNFLEEMLKNDEVSIPTRITSITTELPDWTISTPMTTPMTTLYVSSDDGEVTTLKENYTPIDTTLIPDTDKERIMKINKNVNKNSNRSKDESQEATFERTTHSQEDIEVQKEKDKQNNLENVEIFNQRYNLPSNYPDRSETLKKDKDGITAAKERKSAVGKEKEHIMTLKKQENIEENEHPKNHRTKWSEVKYPSALDKSQTASNLYSTTLIPGVITRNEGDGSIKTISDYVKAIFDSMKSAEENEKAEVIKAKTDTSNYMNDIAPTDGESTKESKEIDRQLDTIGSSQDISVTQRVEGDGTKPKETQEATTKENPTTLEMTTLIPDTTANTVIPSEETLITEPSTTTTKTTTLIKQTGNVFRTNSTMLGKVLRTSTTTKVSHMTEICYRGRCVMTRPKMEDDMTR